jgi:hypothetical protein
LQTKQKSAREQCNLTQSSTVAADFPIEAQLAYPVRDRFDLPTESTAQLAWRIDRAAESTPRSRSARQPVDIARISCDAMVVDRCYSAMMARLAG